MDSAVGKTIAENITKENFKKAANSAIGRQLTKTVADKVDNAVIKGLQKLKFTTPSQDTPLLPPETLQDTPLLPPGTLVPQDTPLLPSGTKRSLPGRKKGKKKRKLGRGIILQ